MADRLREFGEEIAEWFCTTFGITEIRLVESPDVDRGALLDLSYAILNVTVIVLRKNENGELIEVLRAKEGRIIAQEEEEKSET